MSVTSKLSLLSHKKDNKKLILSHLSRYDDTDKLDKITDLLAAYGIRELVRTGVIAMARGAKTANRAGRDVD